MFYNRLYPFARIANPQSHSHDNEVRDTVHGEQTYAVVIESHLEQSRTLYCNIYTLAWLKCVP